LNSDPKL